MNGFMRRTPQAPYGQPGFYQPVVQKEDRLDYYSTDELDFAAFLIASGFQVAEETWSNENLTASRFVKIHFVCESAKDIDEVYRQFWRKELQVEPVSFMEARKFLARKTSKRI